MLIRTHSTDLATATGPMRTYVYEPVEAGQYPALIFYSEYSNKPAPSAAPHKCWQATAL